MHQLLHDIALAVGLFCHTCGFQISAVIVIRDRQAGVLVKELISHIVSYRIFGLGFQDSLIIDIILGLRVGIEIGVRVRVAHLLVQGDHLRVILLVHVPGDFLGPLQVLLGIGICLDIIRDICLERGFQILIELGIRQITAVFFGGILIAFRKIRQVLFHKFIVEFRYGINAVHGTIEFSFLAGQVFRLIILRECDLDSDLVAGVASDQLLLEIVDVRTGTNGKIRAGAFRAAAVEGLPVDLADIVQVDLISILDGQFLICLQRLVAVQLVANVGLYICLIYLGDLYDRLSGVEDSHGLCDINVLDRTVLIQQGAEIIRRLCQVRLDISILGVGHDQPENDHRQQGQPDQDPCQSQSESFLFRLLSLCFRLKALTLAGGNIV